MTNTENFFHPTFRLSMLSVLVLFNNHAYIKIVLFLLFTLIHLDKKSPIQIGWGLISY
jgi:hypothetical protein